MNGLAVIPLERRAKLISEAGPGLAPVSKIREAIYAEAVKQLRGVTGQSDFYREPSDDEFPERVT